jgi:hypothetical protein
MKELKEEMYLMSQTLQKQGAIKWRPISV